MPEDTRKGFFDAYVSLLEPIVSLLVANGIEFEEAKSGLVEAFVAATVRELGEAPISEHVKNVAQKSGMPEDLVKNAISDLLSGRRDLGKSLRLNMSRVLDGWHSHGDYTGPYGIPLDLSFADREAKDPAFEALVLEYAPGSEPETILDELIRAGCVVRVEENRVRATRRRVEFDIFSPALFDRLRTHMSNFVDTVQTNLSGGVDGKKRFERHVWTPDGIDKRFLPEFEDLIERKGMELLEELDSWLASLPRISDQSEVVFTGLGMFHYSYAKGQRTTISELLQRCVQ